MQTELSTKVLDDTCIIVPMYNEEQVIAEVVSELKSTFKSVLCIDDGSTDKTKIRAVAAGATVISHCLNIGQGAALATGFKWVQNQNKYSYIVTFDADGQHCPKDAVFLVHELVRKNLDVIFGSRFLKGQYSNIPFMKQLIIKTATKITKVLTDVQLSDTHNGLRALTVDASRKIDLTQNKMAHATQLVSLVLQSDLKYEEYPVTVLYTPYSRSKGQSMMNSINIVFDLVWG